MSCSGVPAKTSTFELTRFLITFSYRKLKKALFLGSLFMFSGLLNPKIIFLALCLYVCVSACVCLCVTIISITRNQITEESSNLAFYICIIGRCYLKLYKDRTKTLRTRGTQKNSNNYSLWTDFLVIEFSYI